MDSHKTILGGQVMIIHIPYRHPNQMEQIHHIIDWKYVVPSQKWKWQDLKIKLQIQGSIPIPSHIQNQTKRVKEIVSLHAWTVNRCLETEVLGPKVASWHQVRN